MGKIFLQQLLPWSIPLILLLVFHSLILKKTLFIIVYMCACVHVCMMCIHVL